ncbi:MAG: hypothetical protein NC037_00905 [Bacteroides sp.]|nr:hypothetical protein [Bacillota bacterium]MCM1393765.1 hypothetical protein [[Eubacterium] siraeum]MCM1455078.1 hypothetical protein [Bacteroides sp.]
MSKNKKTMKKSMVITTVVMVILLIAALSTATFAWYTAQSNVEITKTWITSASASSANLVLDNKPTTNADANNTSLSLTMDGDIQPMQYNASAAPTTSTTYTEFLNNFVTYTVATSGTNTTYATAPAKGTPSQITGITGGTGTENYMYISNIGGSAAKIEATITIGSYYKPVATPDVADIATYYEKDGSAFALTEDTALDASKTYYEAVTNNLLRVAIFAKVGDAANLTYVGTWGNGTINVSNITIGTAAVGEVEADPTASITALANTNAEIIASLGSKQSAQIMVVSWFEGANLDNVLANGGADFSISFSAATPDAE